jgi:hypothetical protein
MAQNRSDGRSGVLRQSFTQCPCIGIPCCLHDGDFLLQIGNLLIHNIHAAQLSFGLIRQVRDKVVFTVDSDFRFVVHFGLHLLLKEKPPNCSGGFDFLVQAQLSAWACLPGRRLSEEKVTSYSHSINSTEYCECITREFVSSGIRGNFINCCRVIIN